MKIVIIESPFAGDRELNSRYLSACLRDSLNRGEAPFASHALYTREGVLDDDIPEERTKGMEAGWAFTAKADLVAVYVNLGISGGMELGIRRADELGIPFEYRAIRDYKSWGPPPEVRTSPPTGKERELLFLIKGRCLSGRAPYFDAFRACLNPEFREPFDCLVKRGFITNDRDGKIALPTEAWRTSQ